MSQDMYTTRLVDAAGKTLWVSFPFGETVLEVGRWHSPDERGAVAALLVRERDGAVLQRVEKGKS